MTVSNLSSSCGFSSSLFQLSTNQNHSENKADYKVSSSSVGVSTIGMPSMPAGYNKKDNEQSITHSAVSQGTIIIRNENEQKQDINELSRDTEHASNELKHIFDKEKEQSKIDQTRLVSEISGETLTMLNTIDRIKATEEAKKAVEDKKQKSNKPLTDKEQQEIYKEAYDKAMNEGMSAMGSNTRQGIDMAINIINGLITGDMTGAVAGALAPKLATIIKQQTGDNKVANTISHAILGAVVAELQGNSAVVGGVGAAVSERGAEVIASILYPNKSIDELTQDEKQRVSALAQLATGLTIAALGGDAQDINTAIAGGKNAVENNALSRDDSWQKKGIEGKLSFTEMTDEERAYYLDKLKQINELDEKDDKAFLDACAGSGNNTTAACGAQLAKLRAFKDEYEIYFGRYPYSEYLQDDYNKIIGYLNRYTPDEWSYAINNYAKENNISYEEAASKFKFAMYTQKIADVISLYYGVKGVGIVNGKISAVDLAKAEKAINEYNAFKQELNAGKGTTTNKPLDKTDLELQHGKGNVEQGGGNYKETKDKILDNQDTNQKGNQSNNFEQHANNENKLAENWNSTNEAHNAANASKLNAKLVGKEISNGHAYNKHVIKQEEFKDLGITTKEQFATHIENVVSNPTSFKELSGGRTAYWHEQTGTVVIRNPKAKDGGTAFRPVDKRKYFDDLK
ncbi:hypothetical protein A9G09_03940 [Gilliamella sp. wkB292]|uniref:VENN motif pre-toxin domain-containing protein n=1 Tax=Gilliamella sp. wkB292 TaxID=3120262 RepID=UPI00080ED822|nr:VENN motif pre-toxin domain-containing protein [Gilliamella apicola]OCG15887.1 hypothetical protein A9G09_03940 [Gilliamella apicola]